MAGGVRPRLIPVLYNVGSENVCVIVGQPACDLLVFSAWDIASMSDTNTVPLPAIPGEPGPRPRIGPLKLLLVFSQVTISGFGGVAPFAYRAFVERRRWLTNAEFAEMFAFGQLMPGPGVTNFALTMGYRDSGAIGAIAAVVGIVTLPVLLMLLIGMTYSQYGNLPQVRDALTGMSAVTAGLVVAMALKMSSGMHRRRGSLLLLLAAFFCLGVMRWPFLAVIGVLASLGIWLAWRESR